MKDVSHRTMQQSNLRPDPMAQVTRDLLAYREQLFDLSADQKFPIIPAISSETFVAALLIKSGIYFGYSQQFQRDIKTLLVIDGAGNIAREEGSNIDAAERTLKSLKAQLSTHDVLIAEAEQSYQKQKQLEKNTVAKYKRVYFIEVESKQQEITAHQQWADAYKKEQAEISKEIQGYYEKRQDYSEPLNQAKEALAQLKDDIQHLKSELVKYEGLRQRYSSSQKEADTHTYDYDVKDTFSGSQNGEFPAATIVAPNAYKSKVKKSKGHRRRVVVIEEMAPSFINNNNYSDRNVELKKKILEYDHLLLDYETLSRNIASLEEKKLVLDGEKEVLEEKQREAEVGIRAAKTAIQEAKQTFESQCVFAAENPELKRCQEVLNQYEEDSAPVQSAYDETHQLFVSSLQNMKVENERKQAAKKLLKQSLLGRKLESTDLLNDVEFQTQLDIYTAALTDLVHLSSSYLEKGGEAQAKSHRIADIERKSNSAFSVYEAEMKILKEKHQLGWYGKKDYHDSVQYLRSRLVNQLVLLVNPNLKANVPLRVHREAFSKLSTMHKALTIIGSILIVGLPYGLYRFFKSVGKARSHDKLDKVQEAATRVKAASAA